jgi:sulfatase maturation enzyme AslB (radical SAM superfamily)
MTQKYSSFKFFRFPEVIQAIKEKNVLPPVHIRIKPTNICNHDCWYCAYHVSSLQLGDGMEYRDSLPREKMEEIADDLISMGVKAVTFSGGGEPLLYKPLPDIMKKLSNGGVKVASLTNGSNLKGKVADAFSKYASWVRVSLDGYDNKSYSDARRVNIDEFSKLMSNMENFANRKSQCVLGAVYIIDKNNYKHIFQLCKKLKNIGVDHVKLSGVIVGDDAEEGGSYHSEIKKSIYESIKKSKSLEDENFSIIDAYHDLDSRMWNKSYTSCPSLMYCPVIGADSNVYTCHDKAYTDDGLMGSIKDISFKDFWLSEENKKFIYDFDPSKMCKHHCVCHSRNRIIDEFLSIDEEHSQFV